MNTISVCQLDANGFYVGQSTAFEDPKAKGSYLIPSGCLPFEVEPPELKEYEAARWDIEGKKWCFEKSQDSRRSPEEIRISEIHSRLEQIDHFVIRPMHAMLSGASTGEDEIIVAELNREKEELRAELAALAAGE